MRPSMLVAVYLPSSETRRLTELGTTACVKPMHVARADISPPEKRDSWTWHCDQVAVLNKPSTGSDASGSAMHRVMVRFAPARVAVVSQLPGWIESPDSE